MHINISCHRHGVACYKHDRIASHRTNPISTLLYHIALSISNEVKIKKFHVNVLANIKNEKSKFAYVSLAHSHYSLLTARQASHTAHRISGTRIHKPRFQLDSKRRHVFVVKGSTSYATLLFCRWYLAICYFTNRAISFKWQEAMASFICLRHVTVDHVKRHR